MFGELNVGHAYHGGGDIRSGKRVGTGCLPPTCVMTSRLVFWQIEKIYRGEYPMPSWSSPLARADLHVKPGEWLVAIDGNRWSKAKTTSSAWPSRQSGSRAFA